MWAWLLEVFILAHCAPGTCLLVEGKKKLDLKLGAPSVLGTSVSLHSRAVKNKL